MKRYDPVRKGSTLCAGTFSFSLLPAGLDPGARVLIVSSSRRAALFRKIAPHATVVTDIDALERIETRFEAAVVDDMLESEPWDRWTLQCVHRALNMKAPLMLVVAPLASLASLLDVDFLAYASRRIANRLLRRLGFAFKADKSVRRRYHLPRLAKQLKVLGYTSIALRSGWPQSGQTWFARRSIVTARKDSSLSGFHGRKWPDAQKHRKEYAEDWAKLFVARETWLSSHPEYRTVDARPLDLSEWRRASILVLSPHPDDEVIGCGGTLCRMISEGARAWILQATNGCRLKSLRDLPEARRKTIRLEEAERVAEALGAKLFLWRREDSRLECSDETVSALARLLDNVRPTHLFTPFLTDLHADHRVLSRILSVALARVSLEPLVLQYEVWSLVPANLYCDTTLQAEVVERLLLTYRRAMRHDDFVHFCESRNLARALELTNRPGYVEAFLATSSVEFRRLMESSLATVASTRAPSTASGPHAIAHF